jgi:nucleoid-associated protein YgaU
MEIWLVNAGSDRIQLPVNPEELGETVTRNFEDIILANGDEKTVISGKQQNAYSITSWFPKHRPVFSEIANPKDPMDYVRQIKGWMDNKKVLLLQVTTTTINTQVTIRSFDWKEKGGAPGDIEYTIELKQYLPVTFTSSTVSSGKRPPSPASQNKPKTYTVVRRDCLWSLAKKFYGSGSKWPTIYNANKGVIGPNPHWIYPGQKLVIP